MAVTQYIGARYVPLFAEPLDWSSEKEYEPLTIVYNDGNSYTSRQYVPKGIQITNTDYWALTGNYNAQIEQYRSEVQTFDERITENTSNITKANERIAENTTNIAKKAGISHASAGSTYGLGNGSLFGHVKLATSTTSNESDENDGVAATPKFVSDALSKFEPSGDKSFKSALLIGDSWGMGFYNGQEHPSESPLVNAAKLLGIPDGSIFNECVSGSGYTVGGKTFLEQYNVSSHKDADLIIVLGGQNDSSVNETSIKSAVDVFISTIKTGSPNSEIHIFNTPLAYGGRLGINIGNNGPSGRMLTEGTVSKAASNISKNMTIHNGCYRWGDMFGQASSDTDKVHLNASGYQKLANLIAQMIQNNIGDYWPTFYGSFTDPTITGGSIQRNFITECNGIVNACLIWDLKGAQGLANDASFGSVPYWADRSFDIFDSTVFQNQEGPFVAIGGKMTLQNYTSQNLGWVFMTKSYPAGY